MNWFFSKAKGKTHPFDPTVLGYRIGRSEHEDRCIGSLLGCACGDILGANCEFESRSEIKRKYGTVHSFADSSWRPFGMYTDDTEMTLALASSIVHCRGLDPEHCAATYASYFESAPRRGYGPSVTKVLEMLLDGVDYRTTGTAVHEGGSYGNGGAMRIAPVGLVFRNATDSALSEAVRRALLPTHVHREAIDGAFIQAKTVALMAGLKIARELDVIGLLEQLRDAAGIESLSVKINEVIAAHREKWSPEKVLDRVCSPNQFGEHFQIRTADAVACVLWAFSNHWQDPERCIVETVALGGDTDTLGAMAGAIVGALHGTHWLPSRWYENIENEGAFGRDGIIDMAKRLAQFDFRTVAA